MLSHTCADPEGGGGGGGGGVTEAPEPPEKSQIYRFLSNTVLIHWKVTSY